jgi:hypothetical protein
MDPLDTNETMHALRFGEVCGSIENRATLSVQSYAAAVAAMDLQLKELQANIQATERSVLHLHWLAFYFKRFCFFL